MPDRSVVDVFADLLNQLTALLRKESQLARTELSEKVGQAGVGLGLVVGGAVLLIPALVILLQAAVAALIKVIPEPWASLIVGGAAFLIGLLIAIIGMSRLNVRSLAPNRTIAQVQRDVTVAKQQVRESYGQQRAA